MVDFIVWDLLPIWVGIGFWELSKYLVRRVQMPYRWKCPQCTFKLRTSNRETFEISKTSHNHSSTKEYKP